jgi:hypothetical protein
MASPRRLSAMPTRKINLYDLEKILDFSEKEKSGILYF